MRAGHPDRAVEWAASALKRVGPRIPVDVRAACRAVKLYVRTQEMDDDTGGMLTRTPKRRYAVINSRYSEERQRWALAHELCEYLLVRRNEQAGGQAIDWGCHDNGKAERLCDRFAANLLMPEAQVRELAVELHHDRRNDKTNVLASRFGVSGQAMRLRLMELGLIRARRE